MGDEWPYLGIDPRTDAGSTEEPRLGPVKKGVPDMTRMHNAAETAKFFAEAGTRLAAAAAIGAAMVIEVAIARTVLTPLFREHAKNAA